MTLFARRFGFFAVLLALAVPCARADDEAAGLRPVGTTYDACRDAPFVRFQVHDGEAKVQKGQDRLFRLSAKTKELTWYCGDSKERCANGEAFNWVRCHRTQDGRIAWTFYRHD